MSRHAIHHALRRREFLARGAAALAVATASPPLPAAPRAPALRFGLNADPHLLGRRATGNEANFQQFVDQMQRFEPDFAIDLGDFGSRLPRARQLGPCMTDNSRRCAITSVCLRSSLVRVTTSW
ncbi:MAG: hypothetical protein MK364_12910, partial [Pirellulales bacterium]|nr:hypothetical protein [Pirellulales bacterium]